MRTPRLAHLALCLGISAVLAGCTQSDNSTAANVAPEAPSYTLDEAKLPPMNSFRAADIDSAGNACMDFGSYINKNWLAANPIPSDRTSWGAFEMLDERSNAIQRQIVEQAAAMKDAKGIDKLIGDFYATGMDEAKIEAQGISPLKSRIEAIEALSDTASIAEHLRHSYSQGEGMLFGFGPEADFKNSGMNIAYATQGGLGLPDKGFYFDADKQDKRTAYAQYVARILTLSGLAPADAEREAKAVLAFETRLANASKSSEELARDVSLYYHPVSPEEADKLTPNFSWSKFFESQGVEKPAMFSLAVPEFHREVSQMLVDVPVSTWQSYLRFHLVDSAAPYLSSDFVNAHFDFHNKAMRGQQENRERWKRVLGTINSQVGEALGQIYVKLAFPAESKARMETLVKNLGDAFAERLKQLDWMGEETRARAEEKLKGFTTKIGYPNKWRDFSGLETRRDSYIENVLAANAFNYRWSLGKIGKPVDKDEWAMSPQTVNAYYNPLQNEIVFPAAILQPPFFDGKADDALNYGGIGAVIGHEMTHGFDDQGSRFAANGNLENWWQESDARNFKALANKLVQQFDAYEVAGQHVNGKLTLGENIADLGGLAIAYDAYQRALGGKTPEAIDGLSGNQRFFANWATVWRRNFTPDELKVRLTTDSHAPAEFRAIGAPSNLPTFAEAWSCKRGDAMVREGDNQVKIW
ncbi:peptidase [Lysobacteraceae bacterium NML71-0210]|nr:peptidase [Xanthomonadaceae bacterium NML71-0210]